MTMICETVDPVHDHDCDDCTFLGSTTSAERPDRTIDHYWCGHCAFATGTLIQRYGSEGQDYSSIPVKIYETIKATGFASTYQRARLAGLIRSDQSV